MSTQTQDQNQNPLENTEFLMEPKTSVFYVALLRILLGVLFIATWFSNLEKDLYTPDGLEGFLTYMLDTSTGPLPWYESFVRDVIIPLKSVFAPFQLVTELGLGIALLFGFLTRPAAIGGLFFVLNTYLISIGVESEWEWTYFTIMGALAVVAATGAGRSIGVDAFLQSHYDRLLENLRSRFNKSEDAGESQSREAVAQ